MATLLYRGFNDAGHLYCGAKNFSSKLQMESYLRKRRINHYDIYESQTIYKVGLYRLITPKELSVFCKQMSILFYSHITLMEGVLLLAEQTENKQLKLALNEIYAIMEEGKTFAEAIGMFNHIFSTYLLNMIVIGESSGTLDVVFSRMSDYFDKENKIRKKIRSAMVYPTILTTLMAALVVLLVVKVLPIFSDILDSLGVQIPAATRVILHSGSFLAVYAPFIAAGIALIVMGWIFFIHSDKGSHWFAKAKFATPAYRLIAVRVVTARFARSLSILLKSGVPLSKALEDIALLMDNHFLEKKLINAVDQMKDGEPVTDVLTGIGIFPVLFLKMFSIGQKTGNLDEMLDKAATVFDDEVDEALERLTTLLEPILIIILSVIVGIILVSVMLPMITIMNAIG